MRTIEKPFKFFGFNVKLSDDTLCISSFEFVYGVL